MELAHLDFEVRSRVDLRSQGVRRYASDPSTSILCAAYRLPGEDIKLWLPGMPVPDLSPFSVASWNAMFEWEISRYVGWTQPKRWYDVAAHARYFGLPGKLDDACKWLGLPSDKTKDAEGHKIMMKLTSPVSTGKNKGTFINDPAMLARMYEYCKQDIVAEETIFKMLPPWPEQEQLVWDLTAECNLRGTPIDEALCIGATKIAEQIADFAATEMDTITGGVIVSAQQTVALVKWLNEQGINVSDIQAPTVAKLLADKDLPQNVRRLLTARQMGAPASVKKYSAAMGKVSEGRIHHNFMYYGAGSTGRWSGKGENEASVQLQNLKRGNNDDYILDAIKTGDLDILSCVCDTPMKALQTSVRQMVCAPTGKVFLYSDLSAIEARVLRWLAKAASLQAFFDYDNNTGPDPYKLEASKVFSIAPDTVTPDQRQLGKVLVLGAGYGMGGIKFQDTVDRWTGGKVKITESFAQKMILLFRNKNKDIVRFWSQLQTAFLKIYHGDADRVKVGYLTFYRAGKNIVAIELPNGRSIFYNRCKIVKNEIQYTKHDGMLTKFYGGHGAENVTQAVSRDILAEVIHKCETNGLPVIFHAHDSVMVEVDDPATDDKLELLRTIMTTPPTWATGLPLAAPVESTYRMP